jgi:hypothetical protein
MTEITVELLHRRSCANSSALPFELAWPWPDVPCSGSGRPTSGALPPETARKQPGEPHKTPKAGRRPAVALKLVRTPRRTPLQPPAWSAMVAQHPSDPTDEHDRDQPGALCYVARPASAAAPHWRVARRPRDSSAQGAQLITKL